MLFARIKSYQRKNVGRQSGIHSVGKKLRLVIFYKVRFYGNNLNSEKRIEVSDIVAAHVSTYKTCIQNVNGTKCYITNWSYQKVLDRYVPTCYGRLLIQLWKFLMNFLIHLLSSGSHLQSLKDNERFTSERSIIRVIIGIAYPMISL